MSLTRCLIEMSAKKFAGVIPIAFVIAALTGDKPVANITGNEITDAPPAIPLMTPTSKPTAAMAMNSSICKPYTRHMASVQVRLFAVARAKAGAELISCEPGSLASIIESLKAHGELANVLPQCSYLVDGLAPSDINQNISAGSTIDVLPRFAGGA
jgi:molybdopterin converting factor small subunit